MHGASPELTTIVDLLSLHLGYEYVTTALCLTETSSKPLSLVCRLLRRSQIEATAAYWGSRILERIEQNLETDWGKNESAIPLIPVAPLQITISETHSRSPSKGK